MARKNNDVQRDDAPYTLSTDEDGFPFLSNITMIEGSYPQDEEPFSDWTGCEAIRFRPGMYIGDVGTHGLHYLFEEVLGYCVDETVAGHCTTINIVLCADYTLYISDNGQGLPVAIDSDSGKSGIERIMTELYLKLPFEEFRESNRYRSGCYRVGLCGVNALSEWLRCEVRQGNKTYRMRFEQGVPVAGLEVFDAGIVKESGTTVRWLPDRSIFKSALTESNGLEYDGERITERCRELACLLPTAKITFYDQLHGKPLETFCFPNGIADYVCALKQKQHIYQSKPFLFRGAVGETRVEVAFEYDNTGEGTIRSFVNTRPTPEEGTHVNGLLRALTKVRNEMAPEGIKHSSKTSRYQLTAVVSVFTATPLYNSADYVRLMNPELNSLIFATVYVGLTEYFRDGASLEASMHDVLYASVPPPS